MRVTGPCGPIMAAYNARDGSHGRMQATVGRSVHGLAWRFEQ